MRRTHPTRSERAAQRIDRSLQPRLHSVGVSIATERERQQNDRLAAGCTNPVFL